MALSKRTWQALRLRAAVIEAGEAYCCDPDPASSVGGIMCTRPAGHTGKHAAHGTDPDKPLWTWPNEEGTSDGRWWCAIAGTDAPCPAPSCARCRHYTPVEEIA